MGEATYYLLAEFETEEDAKEAGEFAGLVFEELFKFQNEWQKIRDDRRFSVEERHKMLLKKFPLVAKYIRLPRPCRDDPNMNYLAGHCEISDCYSLYIQGKYLKLVDEVWHLASWDNIAEFFCRLGAKRVVWESDEYFDYFELLESRLNEIEEINVKNKFSKSEIRKILLAHKIGRKEDANAK